MPFIHGKEKNGKHRKTITSDLEDKMKKRIAILVVITLALSLCLVSCGGGNNGGSEGQAAEYPLNVTDYLGTEMTIEKEPQKIVSLSPSCTEILYALGLGDKMVGVSSWCTYPKEAADVEKVGDTFSANVERIIELEADIVFVSGQTAADALSALNNAGIPVYSIGSSDMDSMYASIEQVGLVTNTSDAAKKITDGMKKQAEEIKAEFAGYDKKSVFIDLGGLYSTSKVNYLGNTMDLINAENIAYDYDYSSPQLSAETVIEKNPQVYIVMSSKDQFEKPAGFDKIDAFKNGEVYYIPYDDPTTDMISRDGPRFLDGLEKLGNMIHKKVQE